MALKCANVTTTQTILHVVRTWRTRMRLRCQIDNNSTVWPFANRSPGYSTESNV